MSTLPRPFSSTNEGISRPVQSSIFNTKDPAETAHFPPWYSGSSSSSETHQYLSKNRSAQFGVLPSWTSTNATLKDEPNAFHDKRRGSGRGFNRNRSGGFSNGSDKNSFCCDACNRSFETQEELSEHVTTHVKCPFETCKFQAHAKVVALHQRLQHATGLADKLVSLDTPEAIRKWREERKRNFPTSANIERKKKEQAEKLARGEDLQNKYFGKMRGGKYGNNSQRERIQENGVQPAQEGSRGRGRGRGRKRHRNRGTRKPAENDDLQINLALAEPTLCQSTSAHLQQEALPSSFSVKEDMVEENSNDSDEESSAKRSSPPEEKVAHVIGGSLSMLADYGSASDQEEENDGPEKKASAASRFPLQHVPDLYPMQGRNHPSKRSLSLLEKLLANEIRHERNVILQCVHYTVKKNFFDPKK